MQTRDESRQTSEGRSDSVQFYLQHANAATIFYPRRAERWYVQHIIRAIDTEMDLLFLAYINDLALEMHE